MGTRMAATTEKKTKHEDKASQKEEHEKIAQGLDVATMEKVGFRGDVLKCRVHVSKQLQVADFSFS